MSRSVPGRRNAALTVVFLVAMALPRIIGAQDSEANVANARRLYEATNWEGALAELDRLIPVLEPRAVQEAEARAALVAAYELRARARFSLGDQRMAEDDLLRLLRFRPDYLIPGDVTPRLVAVFENVRRSVIGEVRINVAPENADFEVDGIGIAIRSGTIPLAAGSHSFSARRPGFKPYSQEVTVTAGMSQEVSIDMERDSATISVATSPIGVEVFVDGASRGITQRNAAARSVADARESGADEPNQSAPMVIDDLSLGPHVIEYRYPCFRPAEQSVSVLRLIDYRLAAVTLAPATATLQIEPTTAGAVIYLDDVVKGTAPQTLADICEGPRTLELRSPYGRYVSRMDMRAGEKRVVKAELKPAFAILSTSGSEEGIRGAQDVRVSVEQRLASAASITVFAPAADRAGQALRNAQLPAGWLAFDRQRRPIGDAARVTDTARRQLSADLARAVDAQGVAALTAEPGSGAQSEYVLSLLAAGSSLPDVHAFRLEDSDSIRRLLEDLNVSIELYRPTVGLTLFDVKGVSGAVIAAVEPNGPAAGGSFSPGDAIVSANGSPTPDAASLVKLIETVGATDRLAVEVRERTGATRTAELRVVAVPRAISETNQTLPFNQVLLMLNQRLASPFNARDEPVLRLNIGVVLMRLRNFEAARDQLERVRLDEGTGIANGTVQYLLGNCYDSLGLFDQARRAWTGAAASDAWLTEDGPPVNVLAAAKLNGTAGSGRNNRP